MLAGCEPQAEVTTMSQPTQTTTPSIVVRSSAFEPNQPVPRKHTEDGQNVSPPLSWSGVPEGARELALIVDDPDAPRPQPWVHWVLYKIPPETRGLEENVSPAERPAKPGGSRQGKNSWDRLGYGGPAPPRGHGVHHYHFKLYALDAPVNLSPGASKEELLAAMKGHILAQGELIGTYERK